MRYFMKFYPDCTIGTVEQVDDSMTLLSGNDEKGVFNWIEVFDKQQLATARREGWEQGKADCLKIAENGNRKAVSMSSKVRSKMIAAATRKIEVE